MISEAPIPLSAEERALWADVLDCEITRRSTESAAAVRASAWRRFQSIRWLFLTDACPGDSWESATSGPDLTAIGRAHFRDLSPRGNRKSKRSKRTRASCQIAPYTRFVRVRIAEHKEDWADLPHPERMQRIGKEWHELSAEAKGSFAETVVDA
jgi:hypothetical protein